MAKLPQTVHEEMDFPFGLSAGLLGAVLLFSPKGERTTEQLPLVRLFSAVPSSENKDLASSRTTGK